MKTIILISAMFFSLSGFARGWQCVDNGTHPGRNWQQLCDAGKAQGNQFPGQEQRMCEGFPGCVYVP